MFKYHVYLLSFFYKILFKILTLHNILGYLSLHAILEKCPAFIGRLYHMLVLTMGWDSNMVTLVTDLDLFSSHPLVFYFNISQLDSLYLKKPLLKQPFTVIAQSRCALFILRRDGGGGN